MRIIGKNSSGQIVGGCERQAGKVVGRTIDAGLGLAGNLIFDGFRESVNWLYAIGAQEVEVIG